MTNQETYLRSALRRLRLQAATARSEHLTALGSEEVTQLRGQLALAQKEETATRAALSSASLPLDALTARLGLRPIDESILLAAVALEIDPLFVVTVAALGGEELRHGLTSKVLAQLFSMRGEDALELRIDASHPLVVTGLIESIVVPSPVGTLRPWRAPARVVAYLFGSEDLDPLLAHCGSRLSADEASLFDHLHAPLAIVESAIASRGGVVVLIEGLDGAGRRTIATIAAQRCGRQAIGFDAARASLDPQRFATELQALRRECWLRGAVPVITRLDELVRTEGRSGEQLSEILNAIEAYGVVDGAAILTAGVATQLPPFERRVVRVRIEPPDPAMRERIWSRAIGATLGDATIAVAQRYPMTPGVILRAAANTRMMIGDRTPTLADVQAGIAAEVQERFTGLAQRIPITDRWEDLVLPADTLDDVKAFTARAAHAPLVYEKWGFRTKLGKGLGLAALFSGPPGTGKTMVAGLIAHSLGLELYAVDLSQVISKWVGETEKHLARIFDAAAMGQALLLFDEADSLFARRTEVRSSNDRYANLEVNYLLQRIEQFGGVAILTTNFESSVDPAFKRRLAAEVHFYPPDREERARLWRALIPSEAPTDGALDFAGLADSYREMCGGHIRNSVLRAAFLAASEAGSITQDHLIRAARTEYRAMGKVV